jgi:hypothetical protein
MAHSFIPFLSHLPSFPSSPRHVCLFALALVPLLGGGTLIATTELLQQRLLPVCVSSSQASSTLALHVLQNASADVRLHSELLEAGVTDILREAAATLPPNAATIARSALANLEQLTWIQEDARGEHGGEPTQPINPKPADIANAYRSAPTPPSAPNSDSSIMGVVGVSHRAVPQLCQQLMAWSPINAKRRGVQALAEVLGSRSLEPATALELLRRGQVIECLLDILYPEGTAASQQLAYASVTSTGGGKVGPPPEQSDGPLRDGSLHLLALIAHLGGFELLQPLPRIASALGGALVAAEPSVRAHAAAFWRAVTVWEAYAAALARAIYPLTAVRSAGIRVDMDVGAFTSGITILRTLSTPPTSLHGIPVNNLQEAAAGALANVLQHGNLKPLWTTSPDKLAYLTRLDDEQVKALVAIASQLKAGTIYEP